MRRKLRIPIRIKFMLTFLILVSTIVALITFATTNLFQDDKKAYVNGLTSMVALGTAEEAQSVLAAYKERLQLYAHLIFVRGLSPAQQEQLSRTMFLESPELVSVTVEREDRDPAAVFNVSLLESVGLTKEDLLAGDAEEEHRLGEDSIFVMNSTISEALPCFTLAFAVPLGEDAEPTRVRAVIRSERLLHLTSRFSAYRQYLVDSTGRFLAHSDPAQVAGRTRATLVPEAAKVQQEFSAGLTTEFVEDGVDMIGGFASVDFGGIIAGAEIPHSAAHLAGARLVRSLLGLAAGMLVVAIVLSIFWAHRLTRPMERLSAATKTLATGNFDVRVEIDSGDELGDLASSFNQMAGQLEQREEELEAANAQLVQSEKMAAFGQIGAGIAHEVKNPLTGILACAQLAADDVESGSQLHNDLKMIEKESMRCKSIIENLLKFARQEKAEMSPIDINGVIEDSIAIVNHQMEIHEVRVEKDLQPDLLPVFGNANQLQQVFMNLMINAQQAMDGHRGKIRIDSRLTDGGAIELRFADTGPGIPEEIRDKIFEPFFTTKATGKGTGLGLSVSFGIIRDHNGEIDLESEVGQGTTFCIRLPVIVPSPAQQTSELTGVC